MGRAVRGLSRGRTGKMTTTVSGEKLHLALRRFLPLPSGAVCGSDRDQQTLSDRRTEQGNVKLRVPRACRSGETLPAT